MDKIKHCGLGHLILVKVTQCICSEKIILIEFCIQFQKKCNIFSDCFFHREKLHSGQENDEDEGHYQTSFFNRSRHRTGGIDVSKHSRKNRM